MAGRRMWTPDQVRQAAEALGLLTDELRAILAPNAASQPGDDGASTL